MACRDSVSRRALAFGVRFAPSERRPGRGQSMRERGDEAGSGTSLLSTGCCVVGGGPAGMMLGMLLARAGVEVTVLEKHGDFLRDFRGDTIHPSSMEVLHELGLLQEFLELPHEKAHQLTMQLG